MTARILIVEDNRDLALGLRTSLEVEGYFVEVAGDGVEGLERVREDPPDLVVLDLMLPALNGFHVLRTMRDEGFLMPVLILTAKGEEADKVQGFRLGADNYAVKPIGVLELIARVEAMLRRAAALRSTPAPSAERFAFGDVVVDVPTRTVHRAGAPVELSPKEFDLLVYLLRQRGAVVHRDRLLQDVWGYKRPVATRTVDAHMALLRGKLEADASSPRHLLTVRKAGYRLDPGGS
ncbi:MAG: response regulator transcription factor [Gemmatimonadetes bacterium]|nr:response regulator transcription factor [Gemmatimonadota bacterium]